MWWSILDKQCKDYSLNKKIEVKPVNSRDATCCINNSVIEIYIYIYRIVDSLCYLYKYVYSFIHLVEPPESFLDAPVPQLTYVSLLNFFALICI